MDWQPQSPDLNLSENLWDMLEKALHSMQTLPPSIQDLDENTMERELAEGYLNHTITNVQRMSGVLEKGPWMSNPTELSIHITLITILVKLMQCTVYACYFPALSQSWSGEILLFTLWFQ